MDQVIVVCTSKVVQTTKQWYEPWSVVSKPLWAGSNHFSWFKPRKPGPRFLVSSGCYKGLSGALGKPWGTRDGRGPGGAGYRSGATCAR